jgi:DNA primase
LPVAEFVAALDRPGRPLINVRRRPSAPLENAEFAAIVLLINEWEQMAPWLVEGLFDDDGHRLAFLALAAADGDLDQAFEVAGPDAREVLERAAVADLTVVAEVEAKTLIDAAVRRELRSRVGISEKAVIEEDRQARLDQEAMRDPDPNRSLPAAESLLGWLDRRAAERSRGAG